MHTQFGTSCPVCAGPLIQGEGREGCVVCGYAIARAPQRRSLPMRTSQAARRPRQLILPLGLASIAPQRSAARDIAVASAKRPALLRQEDGIGDGGRHQAEEGTYAPPALVATDEIDPRAEETSEQQRADRNADDQHRFRAA
jgi:hypothetical protein